MPHGDCPAVMNSDTVRVITADTSYSKFGHKSSWGVDNRGEVIGEVIIKSDNSVTAWGVLADGTKYEYSLKAIGESGGDIFVGRQLEDKSWVKAKIAGTDEYLVCLGEGRKLTHSRLSVAELKVSKFLDQVPDGSAKKVEGGSGGGKPESSPGGGGGKERVETSRPIQRDEIVSVDPQCRCC